MSWGRLDDSLHRHRKIRKLRQNNRPQVFNAAMTLWTLANSQCCDDGVSFVSFGDACEILCQDRKTVKRAVDALVDSGLWDAFGDGWVFHDWDDYQPQNDNSGTVEVTAVDEAETKRGRNEDEAKTEQGRSDPKVPAEQYKDRARIPSRPVPVPESAHTAREPVPQFDARLGFPPPPAPGEPSVADIRTVINAYEAAWVRHGGKRLGLNPGAERERVISLLEWATAERPDDPVGQIAEAAEAACASPQFRALGGPWAAFCRTPGRNLSGKPHNGPDADLAEQQRAAQAKLDAAIGESVQAQIEHWRAEVDRIAAERREVRKGAA
jgi:hypothetical protein